MTREDLSGAELFDHAWLKENDFHRFQRLQPITEVIWADPSENLNIRLNDPVIAFSINEKFYLIPWYVFEAHHVANLKIDSTEITIPLCRVCSGSSVFIASIGKKSIKFRHAGLYNGAMIVSDQMGEYWDPYKGECLTGPQKGSLLERIPSFQCTWKEWIQLGNNNFQLAILPNDRLVKKEFIIGTDLLYPDFVSTLNGEVDPRLRIGEMVLGLIDKTESKAYPFTVIQEKIVVMDEFSNSPLVIFSHEGTSIISAFSRRVNDKILQFKLESGEIKDANTGSTWNAFGECTAGELKGNRLTYMDYYSKEWYAWAAYHPETTIYNNFN